MLIQASARAIPLADESVQCVVTSPPYWGLRQYAGEQREVWGGDPKHGHEWGAEGVRSSSGGLASTTIGNGGGQGTSVGTLFTASTGAFCSCGAWYGALGLEPTPDLYVAHMVDVFREVKRVLRPDGTLWLNLGDSYNNRTRERTSSHQPGLNGIVDGSWAERAATGGGIRMSLTKNGLKEKDLVGIPWMVAFALRADGWVLRSDIVWAKPNPMPESVADRPTKSHEMLFLFSKGKRVGPEPTKYDDIPEGEARWLAALFDGEGSLVCRRESPGENDYGAHAAQVSIGSTSRALLERLARVVGEGAVLERGGQNAPMHYWQTSGKRALGLLRRIYPFLVVKQRQARCLIALEERKAVRGGHVRLGADEIAYRERIWEAVKALNHFGEPDLGWVPEVRFGSWTSQPYYYDADAIREPVGASMQAAIDRGPRRPPDAGYQHDAHNRFGKESGNRAFSDPDSLERIAGGRNKRDVWTIPTHPYAEAHFATYPEALVEPCILAGSAAKACGVCGAPWERVTEREGMTSREWQARRGDGAKGHDALMGKQGKSIAGGRPPDPTYITTGWQPTCDHDDGSAASRILDPFNGSGTTGAVALRLGREYVGLDLSAEYLAMAARRIGEVTPVAQTVEHAARVAGSKGAQLAFDAALTAGGAAG